MPVVDDQIQLRTGESIPVSSLEFSTSRSGGPGGQNVNKVETRVEVWLQVQGSPWLSESSQQRLAQKLASKIDNSGSIRIASSTERTQRGNRAAALDRLDRLLNIALTPEKKRLPTRATKGAKERRLDSKRREGEKKASRGRQGWE